MVIDKDRSVVLEMMIISLTKSCQTMAPSATLLCRWLWRNEMKISKNPNLIVPYKRIVSLLEGFCKEVNSDKRGTYNFVDLNTIKEFKLHNGELNSLVSGGILGDYGGRRILGLNMDTAVDRPWHNLYSD
jgi:hypothetical protein